MRQQLNPDSVSRHIDATPEALYELISDVTRTPELSDDLVSCTWLDGATGPAVGARFKAINRAGRGPNWSNKPVVTVADPGREFAFERSEPFAGTVRWSYRFEAEGTGTKVTESFAAVKPLTIVGWFIIGTLYGLKDRQSDLHASMVASLEKIASIVEPAPSRP